MKPGKGLCIALVACAVLPAQAAASTVQVTAGGELRFDGGPGESNRVVVRYRPADRAGFGGVAPRLVIEDSVGAQSATPETCLPIDARTISCDARPVRNIVAELGDGDDQLSANGSVPAQYSVTAKGGDGIDVIRGGDGNDRLFGEGGRDVVAGWRGDDLVSGGAGTDAVIGFTGNDRLLGGPAPDVLFAQKGHDRLLGGAGKDILAAADGQRDPVINCGPGGGRGITDRHDPKPRRCAATPKKK